MQSADRALQILSRFDVSRPTLGVTELAEELGVHKSTASRLLARLEQRGFVRRAGDRFAPGLELARIAHVADPIASLVEIAGDAMGVLAATSGEVVNLGIRRGNEALYIGQRRGIHILAVADWVGRSSPLHSAAIGKALLAFSPNAYEGELVRHTEKTIVDRAELESDLARVRTRGYSVMRDELEEGLSAVAAPIFDPSGACIAAISVTGPSFRVARQIATLGNLCIGAAVAVSYKTGALQCA